ncbi:major facilitator superfamily domain-containing protein [Coniochaeta sp. 2T2.1]|nr:major facilitator superfamily domain-containing protein [Coniochaeta sp. 2T2.1]
MVEAPAETDASADESGTTPQKQDDAERTTALDGGPDNREYPTGLKRALILTPVTLAYFLFFLDLAIISTATPAITSRFNSLVDVGWYGGAYQLGGSAFQPLSGKIFKFFSIKWSFLSFLFIFELGSLLCATATSSSMFIVGRAIAGVGGTGIDTGALTIIAAVLPPRAQAKFMGLNIGLGQVGLALGPILGGTFTQYVSWRWCFYINLVLGAPVALLLFLTGVPEPEAKPPARQVLGTAIKSLDLPGFVLISPAAIMFLLGLQYGGNEHAWDSSVVIGLFVGAAVTFGLFLAWEYREGDNAMVPYAMLRHRIIWSAAGNMFFVLGSVLIADYYISIYFQAVHDDSPLMSGVHLLPTTLGMILFTMMSGMLIEVLGYYLPWTLAGACISAVGYGLLSTLSPTTPAAKWIGYQVFYGAGSGSMSAAAYIAIQNIVPASQISIAMAIVIFWQNLGGAVFLVAANTIFSNSLRKLLTQRVAETGIDPEVVIGIGASSVRKLGLGPEQLAAVLKAYSDSVDRTMYLGVGASVAAFGFAFGLGWRDIRVERKLKEIREKDGAEVEGESSKEKVIKATGVAV